jgi:hypothetical protein
MRAPRLMRTALATLGVLAGGLMFAGAPALAAPPEEPVTKAATAITGTTATLNGELNPAISATTGYDFTYNTNGECTAGTTTTQGAEATGTKIEVSTPLTGLIPSTEYTFCVLATHLVGEVTESTPGLPLKFNTLGLKPVVVSESSSGETPFAAELKAEVNPENQPTTSCEFQYGETIAYGKSATCAEPETLEGPIPASTSAHLTELEKNTTYHYHVVVKNATGETEGADKVFETQVAKAPVVGSERTSALTSTGATLQALVNPNYQATTYAFKYALNEALTEGAVTVTGAGPLAAEFAELPVSVNTGVLAPRTTYFYRASATNETGTTEAATVEHFTTLATPLVTTGAASNITRTSATLSGTVNPGGVATTSHFAFIDQAGYEAAVAESAANPYAKGGSTSEVSVGSDYTSHAVGPLGVNELQPGVTYDYAVVATNSVGTEIGPDAAFTTSPPTPPLASTGAAEGVTQLAARINGSVDTRGLPTISQFEFGTTPYAGSLQPATVTSSSGSVETIATSFNNDLQSGTTYFYRTVATNAEGTAYGAEQSFTTGSFPAAFTPSAAPAFIPYTSIAALDAREAQEGKKTLPKPLTKTQKLAAALKACKKKPKKQRAGCKRQARKKYGTSQKKK